MMTVHRLPYLFTALSCLLLTASACAAPAHAADVTGDVRDSGGKVQGGGDDDPPDLDEADERALQVRRDRCEAEKGVFIDDLTVTECIDGKFTISLGDEGWEQDCASGDGMEYEHQCVHYNTDGKIYFNDGPSAPTLPQALTVLLGEEVSNWRWNQEFWPAGVNHDYCYHHNPSTYGKSQYDCDMEFYADMKAICSVQETPEDRDGCRANAVVSTLAVRVAGKPFYEAMDTLTQYPDWVPQWKVLGLPELPTDEKMDGLLEHYEDLADTIPWVDSND